jgi:hypothetical protein
MSEHIETFYTRFISYKPVSKEIPFGVTDNVVLLKVSLEDQKRDGLRVTRNCYMTFAQVTIEGDKRTIVAEKVLSYFDADPTSDYVRDNVTTQMTQQFHIIRAVTDLDTASNFNPVKDMNAEEFESVLKNKKKLETFITAMNTTFYNLIAAHIGLDSTLLRIKLVTDKTGKYLQQPKDANFVEKMSDPCSLVIKPYEFKNFANKDVNEKVAADNATTAPPSMTGAPKIDI